MAATCRARRHPRTSASGDRRRAAGSQRRDRDGAEAAEAGTAVLAATPHLSPDFPAVHVKELAERCEQLREALAAAAITLRLVSGAEVSLVWALEATDEELALATYGQRGTDLLVEAPEAHRRRPRPAPLQRVLQGAADHARAPRAEPGFPAPPRDARRARPRGGAAASRCRLAARGEALGGEPRGLQVVPTWDRARRRLRRPPRAVMAYGWAGWRNRSEPPRRWSGPSTPGGCSPPPPRRSSPAWRCRSAPAIPPVAPAHLPAAVAFLERRKRALSWVRCCSTR